MTPADALFQLKLATSSTVALNKASIVKAGTIAEQLAVRSDAHVD